MRTKLWIGSGCAAALLAVGAVWGFPRLAVEDTPCPSCDKAAASAPPACCTDGRCTDCKDCCPDKCKDCCEACKALGCCKECCAENCPECCEICLALGCCDGGKTVPDAQAGGTGNDNKKCAGGCCDE